MSMGHEPLATHSLRGAQVDEVKLEKLLDLESATQKLDQKILQTFVHGDCSPGVTPPSIGLQREVKGDGGEVNLDERAEVHGPRELAGPQYGAAEKAKNEMMILYTMVHGEPDFNFAGLLTMLMSKVSRFTSNPLNGDSYEDAIGYIKLIREYALLQHTDDAPPS